jgi:hypothetical protein
MLVMQSGSVDPSVPADAWVRDPVLGAIHSVTGLPALASLFLLPMLAGALAWGLPVAFERIARRIDPDDRAWTSFTWALRSWRGALRWLAWVLVPTLALWYIWSALWKAGIVQAPEPSSSGLRGLLFLSVPFLLHDARNYASAEPPRRWSARWPTRQVWFLLAAMFAVAGLAFLGRADLQAKVQALAGSGRGMALLAVIFCVVWLAVLVLDWMVRLAWLGRTPWIGIPSLWRRGLHPRVLATSALQWARPALYLGLALLPLLAWGWFFVLIVPQAEGSLRSACFSCCTACTGSDRFWDAMIDASRHLVAWWWAYSLGASLAASAVLGWLTPWFGEVAWARLMLEMGVVDAATPPTRPDCGPPAISPPTA